MDKDKHLPRIVDHAIRNYLDDFTAIHIRGPKWCEKTYTSEHFTNNFDKDSAKVSYKGVTMTAKLGYEF